MNQDNFHKKYIRSKEFDNVRQAVFARDNYQCVICGRTDNLVCHHKCYKHLGEGNQNEIDDCVTLCQLDHVAHHRAKYNYKWYSKEHPRNTEYNTISIDGKELIITINGDVYEKEWKKKNVYVNKERNNYTYVNLGNKSYSLHRIIAQAFPEICGEWFDGCEVHHIDNDTTNNKPDNLMVVTPEIHDKFHSEETARRIKEISSKKVNQFSLDGVLIATYSSVSEASQKTNISRTAIENVINGWNVSCGNYQWSYETSVKPIKSVLERSSDANSKPISQFTKEGDWIADYKNQNEAYHALKRKKSGAISNCLKGRSKTAFGFQWKYQK